MRRTITPELLDSDAGTAGEIAASFGDLERVARWFGGASTLAALVRRAADGSGERRLTVLDVGAGTGYVSRRVMDRVQRADIKLAVTLSDLSPLHVAPLGKPTTDAQARTPVPHEYGSAVAANALALPFREKSFDLVACSTFAHHLEPNEIIMFVNRALTIARSAVLINDLRRSAAHLALVYMGFPLFRSRLTRHDAPASVRRAYTPQEMRELLKQTTAKRIEISNHYLYRLGAIAWAS